MIIDLHSHVLPGIDDGPPDLAASLAMAHCAWETGTRRLVATPHLREDHPLVRPGELADRVEQLRRSLARRALDLELVQGAEVDLSAALELDEQSLGPATLGARGADLLIETPYGPVPSLFEGLLERVVARGYRVTLAHPELNPSFQREPERLGRLAAAGVLVQLTARSLRPGRGSHARALALRAVREGWAHVLASDGHSADWRPPNLGGEVAQAAERMPGLSARLAWMINEAPAAVIAGERLPAAPPAELARVGWRARLRRGG